MITKIKIRITPSRSVKKMWIEWICASISENLVLEEMREAFNYNKVELPRLIKDCSELERITIENVKREDYDSAMSQLHRLRFAKHKIGLGRRNINNWYTSRGYDYNPSWRERRYWIRWILGSLENQIHYQIQIIGIRLDNLAEMKEL